MNEEYEEYTDEQISEWDKEDYRKKRKMINLLNKLLSRFNLQVGSKEPKRQEKEESFLEAIINHPEFLKKYPDFLDKYFSAKKPTSLYVGDISYIQYKNGKTYFKGNNTQKYFCDYDMKKPSQEVLRHMIAETTFTAEELEEKLNND
jgi:arsenate reductase-like glutaredoxin family protein